MFCILNVLCLVHLYMTVQALRGASQIVELAIETLRRELPPTTAGPAELNVPQAVALTKKTLEGKARSSRRRDEPLAEEESIV